jgi:uncharacterized protein
VASLIASPHSGRRQRDLPNATLRTVTADLRSALRRDLTAALKARQAETVSALRTALAALENAEAVEVQDQDNASSASAHFAGARSGPGSAEVPRRQLDPEDLRSLLEAVISDFEREARRYHSLGQAEVARRLEGRAAVLSAYVPTPPPPSHRL